MYHILRERGVDHIGQIRTLVLANTVAQRVYQQLHPLHLKIHIQSERQLLRFSCELVRGGQQGFHRTLNRAGLLDIGVRRTVLCQDVRVDAPHQRVELAHGGGQCLQLVGDVPRRGDALRLGCGR